jgi:lipooligosaccharide transport system permease protein
VELTPLYRGVHLLRACTTGTIDATVLIDVVYLGTMSVIGVAVTSRRLRFLLLK